MSISRTGIVGGGAVATVEVVDVVSTTVLAGADTSVVVEGNVSSDERITCADPDVAINERTIAIADAPPTAFTKLNRAPMVRSFRIIAN